MPIPSYQQLRAETLFAVTTPPSSAIADHLDDLVDALARRLQQAFSARSFPAGCARDFSVSTEPFVELVRDARPQCLQLVDRQRERN